MQRILYLRRAGGGSCSRASALKAAGAESNKEGVRADIAKYVDKAHEQKEFAELAELPIDALQGVSKTDAEAPQRVFGVKTICQLAEHKFIKAAQAITLLAGAR